MMTTGPLPRGLCDAAGVHGFATAAAGSYAEPEAVLVKLEDGPFSRFAPASCHRGASGMLRTYTVMHCDRTSLLQYIFEEGGKIPPFAPLGRYHVTVTAGAADEPTAAEQARALPLKGMASLDSLWRQLNDRASHAGDAAGAPSCKYVHVHIGRSPSHAGGRRTASETDTAVPPAAAPEAAQAAAAGAGASVSAASAKVAEA